MNLEEITYFLKRYIHLLIVFFAISAFFIWTKVFYYTGETKNIEGIVIDQYVTTIQGTKKNWFKITLSAEETVDVFVGQDLIPKFVKGETVILIKRETRVRGKSSYRFLKYKYLKDYWIKPEI